MQRTSTARPSFGPTAAVAVIAILVLMAAVLVPAVGSPPSGPRDGRVSSDMDAVARAFNAYFIDTGVWPSNGSLHADHDVEQELIRLPCLYANVHGLKGWAGPYLEEGYRLDGTTTYIAVPGTGEGGGLRDPWGHNYMLFHVSRNAANGNGAILLVSKGPDGTLSTTASNVMAGMAKGDDLLGVVAREL